MKLPDDTAFCIATFEREALVRRLLTSIESNYPGALVVVANDGRAPLQLPGATVHNLEFDRGLSAKRNLMARTAPVETDYLLFLDDDNLVTPATRVDRMRAALDADPHLGLVSGRVYDNGLELRPYEATMRWDDDGRTLRLETAGAGRCDLTQNFFLARREVFRSVCWRDELKLAEHVPFFIDLKASGWWCAHLTTSSVEHWPVVEGEYATFRRRQNQFQKQWMDAYGLTKVVRPNGVTIERDRLDEPGYWPWAPISGP